MVKEKDQHDDFLNVEQYSTYLTSEELPEGAYGSPIHVNEPVTNKSTPWKEGQQFYSAFNNVKNAVYEYPPRQMEGSEPKRKETDDN